MNKRTPSIGLAVLAALLLVSTATAQTSTTFDLSWYVLAGGGERAASTSYALNGTLGQWAVGCSDSTNYGMGAGYWYGVAGGYKVYLPLVLK